MKYFDLKLSLLITQNRRAMDWQDKAGLGVVIIMLLLGLGAVGLAISMIVR